MVRSILKGKHLPNKLYGEAVSTTTYILNICLTKRLEGITPEDCWSGVKPSLSHLKVFGSITRRHVPDQMRRKLDDKSSQMILVGYHSTGEYKIFNPLNKQVVINMDVIVDELKEYNWTKNIKKNSMRIICDEPFSEVVRDVQQDVREVRKEDVEGQASTNRDQRTKNMHARLQECVITLEDMVDDEGELVHYAFYADTEPVNAAEALKDSIWMKVMVDVIKP